MAAWLPVCYSFSGIVPEDCISIPPRSDLNVLLCSISESKRIHKNIENAQSKTLSFEGSTICLSAHRKIK